MSTEVSTLGISVYVLGFAIGPIVWAPYSEVKGRRRPMLLGMMGFTLFEFGVAVARDIQTIIVCRYFSGVFGSSSITLVAAVLSDVYTGRARGLCFIMYVITVFSGTFLGPCVGGFTVMNSSLGWRWTQHICGILGGASTLSLVLLLDESYAPVVQANKAAALRRRTGNWNLHSGARGQSPGDRPDVSGASAEDARSGPHRPVPGHPPRFCLRPALSLPDRVPDRLPTDPRVQSWGRQPALSQHDGGTVPLRSRDDPVPTLVLSKGQGEQRQGDAGVAPCGVDISSGSLPRCQGWCPASGCLRCSCRRWYILQRSMGNGKA